VCHWLTVMAPAQVIEVADLPPELRAAEGHGSEIDWMIALRTLVKRALMRGETGVMDRLTRDFERLLISTALAHTAGRRIEAANLQGIGRNTITRKIQELGIEEKDEPEESATTGP